MQLTQCFFLTFCSSAFNGPVCRPYTNSCKGAKPVNDFQEKEEGGRGRFKSHTNAPDRISDRVKKAPLKT